MISKNRLTIINTNINTVTNGIIEDGFLHIKDGIIEHIGQMSEFSPISDYEVIDFEKKISLYPGFVDAHTHIGLFENGLGFEGNDGNESSEPITPALRAIDGINPTDKSFEEALSAGVTTAVVSPGSSNPIAGQIAAIKTFGKCIDDMIIKSPVAIKFSLGENPKSNFEEKEKMPTTRMTTAYMIREALYKAKYYKDGEDTFDISNETLSLLLKGKISAHFHAHRADDIFTAIRIAEEFGIKFTIIHGTEGHLVREKLKEKNVDIVSGPILCERSKPELVNLTPQSTGMLADCGVMTGITTDHPVVPIQYLTLCAALAVREGMDYDQAIKSITINPAKICMIDDRVGSIEVGKDADLVAFKKDDDILNIKSKPKMVVVSGNIIFNK